jgi:3-oxoacyl-[acyl-carrier-protein] synthase II
VNGRIKALSKRFQDDPSKASRPFDSKRDGFVMGEGSAVLVLEELNRAKSRNAQIYGEIVGFGMASDPFHYTLPSPDGSGARQCMLNALRDASIESSAIGYINAHATSTLAGIFHFFHQLMSGF